MLLSAENLKLRSSSSCGSFEELENVCTHYAVISKCNRFCYYFVRPSFITSLLPTEHSCYEEITKHKVDISVLTFDNHSLPQAVWSDVTNCPTETAADLQVITTHNAGDHYQYSHLCSHCCWIQLAIAVVATKFWQRVHTVWTNFLHLSSQPIWICQQVFVPRLSVVF